MKDVLPIRRGRFVEAISNKIGIDLEDDTWAYEPYVEDETDTLFGEFLAYLQNNEVKVWLSILLWLVFVL